MDTDETTGTEGQADEGDARPPVRATWQVDVTYRDAEDGDTPTAEGLEELVVAALRAASPHRGSFTARATRTDR